MFETYRENVDGKYWFPDYSRSDGTYKMKDRDVPIRVTIKWTNFKPFPAVAVCPAAPQSTALTLVGAHAFRSVESEALIRVRIASLEGTRFPAKSGQQRRQVCPVFVRGTPALPRASASL